MSAGDLVLAAPSRCARSFTNAGNAFVSMYFDQQERGDRVRPTPSAANRKLGFDGNTNRNRFEECNFQSRLNWINNQRIRRESASPLHEIVHKRANLIHNTSKKSLSLFGSGKIRMS